MSLRHCIKGNDSILLPHHIFLRGWGTFDGVLTSPSLCFHLSCTRDGTLAIVATVHLGRVHAVLDNICCFRYNIVEFLH